MSLLSPSTYLDLVQRFALECGITEALPTTVQNPTGQLATLCNYINQSWLEIQTKHDDWKFMRVSPGASFVTIAGQQLYTPTQTGIALGAVSSWARHTFRVYTTAIGTPSEIQLTYLDYDDWRDTCQLGTLRTSQVPPILFTIAPDFSIGLQCPLAGYTITGDYYNPPIPFAADADVPSIPSQFIMTIVYEAMQMYGLFESAPEVFNQGKVRGGPLMTKLENSRLMEVLTSGGLA